MAMLDMMMTILCDTYVASGAATQLLGRHTTDREIVVAVADAVAAAGSAEVQVAVATRRPPVAEAACEVERARVVAAAQHKIGR